MVSAAPSNRDDEFLAGSYGGVNRIGLEGDTHSLYMSHGFDWIWLQHKLQIPQILAGQGADKMLAEVSKRCRVLLRVLWWGNHKTLGDWQHELNTYGIKPTTYGGEDLTGKDWIDLADDPELLAKAIRTIDWEIDTIEQRCGKGTLYAVTLSEEEPDVGMYFGRGMSWFAQHEAEAWPKIEKVHNALYDHVKQKYPHLKVGITFYPGAVKRGKVKMKYDLVCIDPYPEKGQLDQSLAECKEVYGVSDDVYILLWGCGSVRWRCCLKPYQEDTDWAETVFKAFRGAGYRNIGWFGLNYKANSFDRIINWIDGQSPGTYAPGGLADALRQAQVRRTGTFATLRALPAEVVTKTQTAAKDYEAVTAKTTLPQRERLRRAAEARDKLVTLALNTAEETAKVLRAAGAADALETSKQFLVAYGLSEAAGAGLTREERDGILYHCSAFERLPEFYRLAQPVTARLQEQTGVLLQQTTANLKRLGETHPGADLARALRLAEDLAAAWKQFDFRKGLQVVEQLTEAASEAGVSEGVTLTAYLVNPYSYEVNARPAVRISDDGEKWTEVYRGEPFHGEFRPVLRIPLKAAPKFVMVDNGEWTGDFGVDAMELAAGSRRTVMKAARSSGVVREAELANEADGKYARIAHVGGGYEKDYLVFAFP